MHSLRTHFHMNRLASLLLLVVFLLPTGCSTLLRPIDWVDSLFEPAPLKVGIAADRPPLAFKKNSAITGLEARFAGGFARKIRRKVAFIELTEEEMPQALLEGKVDILMSGLTARFVRSHQLQATKSYLRSGQIPLVHLNDYKKLATKAESLAGPRVRLGVVTGGKSEQFVKTLNPKGRVTRFTSVQEGVQALVDNQIDAYLDDMPTNFYYASLYVDRGLTPGLSPMNRERLVWAVRPDNTELRDQANDYLMAIRKSGELRSLLEYSIPFYKNSREPD